MDVEQKDIALRDAIHRVGKVVVFYHEAGPAEAPTLRLLHGRPTSAHMFGDLILLLVDG